MYLTYILYSDTLDRYYIGYTGDLLIERLRKHNTNGSFLNVVFRQKLWSAYKGRILHFSHL
ncbi:GIY-YIG nuclease family protein [Bizionia paragorgiae]|uniref:GIY-YIG nuclease family protein n=1 Tax=Bizionia paragorgiae TaxID=283786 RepID=UPI00299ECE8C|nr:GIY-YIG nuclease family protein [Bizionia paragorgiae]MDX1270388.1 GIY-YIG nuclease family protein [Bizionia paragorgiae]